jgi:hypothetical protein
MNFTRLPAQPTPRAGAKSAKTASNPNDLQTSHEEIRYGHVSSFEQLCEAFKLVHDNYVRARYMPPHPSGMCHGVLQLLPTSHTWTATRGGALLATASGVVNSAAGLPSNAVFQEEFDQLARQGRRIVEATMLACSPSLGTQIEQVSRQLMYAVMDWTIKDGIDDLCVVVNPGQSGYWRGLFRFEELGEAKGCYQVAAAPGRLLRLNLRAIRAGEIAPPSGLKPLSPQRTTQPAGTAAHYCISHEEAMRLLVMSPEMLKNPVCLARLRQFYPPPAHLDAQDSLPFGSPPAKAEPAAA